MPSSYDPYAPDVSEARVSENDNLPVVPEVSPVPSGSVREIERWVGTDPERARLARDRELERGDDARKGVLRYTEDLLA